jgi:hypothetical protein
MKTVPGKIQSDISPTGQMPRLLQQHQITREYPINQISRLKEMKLLGNYWKPSTSEDCF